MTLPRAVATRYGIEPGDEIEFMAAGDGIRILTGAQRTSQADREQRLELFDATTARLRGRVVRVLKVAEGRGWTRDELYGRGRTD